MVEGKYIAYAKAGSGNHVGYGHKTIKEASSLKLSPLRKVSEKYGCKRAQ